MGHTRDGEATSAMAFNHFQNAFPEQFSEQIDGHAEPHQPGPPSCPTQVQINIDWRG